MDLEFIYFSGFHYKLGLSIADYRLGESRMILSYQVIIVLNKIQIRCCLVLTNALNILGHIHFLDHFIINLSIS